MFVKLIQKQGRGQGPGASPTARIGPLFASPGVFSSYAVRRGGAGRKSEHLPGVRVQSALWVAAVLRRIVKPLRDGHQMLGSIPHVSP